MIKYNVTLGTNFTPEIIKDDGNGNAVLRVFRKAGETQKHEIDAEDLKDARAKADKLAADNGMQVTGLWINHCGIGMNGIEVPEAEAQEAEAAMEAAVA